MQYDCCEFRGLALGASNKRNTGSAILETAKNIVNVTHQAKWLILLTLLVNAAAMLSPVINGGDSVTYASLARHIALNNDWVNLVLDGRDWLDKPHLPFWLTALSFKLFGVSSFTYILPGFVFHLIGAYFTYRIARLFYGRDSAWLAVLVYVSVFEMMDSSIEVKAETYLTGCIMAACYYWLRFDTVAKLKYLLLGALFSAMAVMTKGVFTLIAICGGLICMWLYRGQWRKLVSLKWLLALALTLLFTAPELVALYLQFDAHPEKVVFGQTQVSGIKFFLWDSQFGRFFNTGPIQNHNGNPLYFVNAFLWTFLPWVAVFLAAVYSGMRRFVSHSTGRARFIFLCASFFFPFLIFSATQFQFEYYTVIIFPFAAILCGQYLADYLARPGGRARLLVAQWVIIMLLLVLAAGLSVYIARPVLMIPVLVISVGLLLHALRNRKQARVVPVLVYPVIAINALYAFLVAMTALTFTSISVAHNVDAQLSGKSTLPIYVYQMPMVARELTLYSRSACHAVDDAAQLPAAGSRYFLVARADQFAQLKTRLGDIRQEAEGNWAVHKTGTFPRLLRLAKGQEPLETIVIVQVGGVR
jgi:4-amino-4-deoxy-L-arabinose transferase-like glycosyltransferase